ncbi:hypothetical protein C7449_103537 [Mycoplana dimorpha]|uniref:Uncharacterized protein n=1 Tax=Mycoplana dimorpha TaxID=28320 RepID=A0A2T5BC10_MYCDI|nr:hypothetical protein C7449_103537 [Mycoplana dimorpha]
MISYSDTALARLLLAMIVTFRSAGFRTAKPDIQHTAIVQIESEQVFAAL